MWQDKKKLRQDCHEELETLSDFSALVEELIQGQNEKPTNAPSKPRCTTVYRKTSLGRIPYVRTGVRIGRDGVHTLVNSHVMVFRV